MVTGCRAHSSLTARISLFRLGDRKEGEKSHLLLTFIWLRTWPALCDMLQNTFKTTILYTYECIEWASSNKKGSRKQMGETRRNVKYVYLLILLSVRLMWGNFSLNVSFISFFRSDGFTYSMTVVCRDIKETTQHTNMTLSGVSRLPYYQLYLQ